MTSASNVAQLTLRKMMLALALAVFSAASLSACNTVDGAGKDIESAGEAIQDDD
jgi:predicted small secreted protein